MIVTGTTKSTDSSSKAQQSGSKGTSLAEISRGSRIRVVQHVQNKPILPEEFKRNLSLIAKNIAAKMLTASNPSSTPEQQRNSLNQLMSQLHSASVASNSEKPEQKKSEKPVAESQLKQVTTFNDGFQQMILDYFVRIVDGMNELMDEVKDIATETQNIKSLLLKPGDVKVMNTKQLSRKHSYNIPLETMEEFERFDKELENPNSTLRSDFCAILPSALDSGLVMSKCVVKMLKMFVSKDVAMQFTAVKLTKGKKIMKTTNLFCCMEAIIRERRAQCNLNTTDKEMTSALSVVLTNAQNWQKGMRPDSSQQKRQSGQQNEDSSSQGELLATYEVLPTGSGFDPLFEVKYLD